MRDAMQLALCLFFWIGIAFVCLWAYSHPEVGSVPQPY